MRTPDFMAFVVAWILVVSAVIVGTVAAHLVLRRIGGGT